MDPCTQQRGLEPRQVWSRGSEISEAPSPGPAAPASFGDEPQGHPQPAFLQVSCSFSAPNPMHDLPLSELSWGKGIFSKPREAEGAEAAAFYMQGENGTRGASLHVAPVEHIHVHLIHQGCCKEKGAAKPQACHGSELNEDTDLWKATLQHFSYSSALRGGKRQRGVARARAGNSPNRCDVMSPFAEVLQEFVFARLSQNRLSEKAVKSKSNETLRQTQHPAGSHRRPRSGCVTPAACCLGRQSPAALGCLVPWGKRRRLTQKHRREGKAISSKSHTRHEGLQTLGSRSSQCRRIPGEHAARRQLSDSPPSRTAITAPGIQFTPSTALQKPLGRCHKAVQGITGYVCHPEPMGQHTHLPWPTERAKLPRHQHTWVGTAVLLPQHERAINGELSWAPAAQTACFVVTSHCV